MKCSHCETELTNYQKSNEIPGKKNWYFIVCNCGNVMEANIENDSINVLQNTSKKKGFRTRKQILLALRLFKEAGVSVRGYSVNNPDSQDVDIYENKNLKTRAIDLYKTVF